MSTTRLFALTTLVALAGALAQPAQAQVQSFNFSQGGYADGAMLTGHFAGEDLDGDGWLQGYELTEFELHFSGNRAVEAFDHVIDDSVGLEFNLEFDLATYRLSNMSSASRVGDSEWLFSFESMGPTYRIPGVVTDEQLGVASMSWDSVRVSAVPEPGSLAMLLSGLGLVGMWSRRRFGR